MKKIIQIAAWASLIGAIFVFMQGMHFFGFLYGNLANVIIESLTQSVKYLGFYFIGKKLKIKLIELSGLSIALATVIFGIVDIIDYAGIEIPYSINELHTVIADLVFGITAITIGLGILKLKSKHKDIAVYTGYTDIAAGTIVLFMLFNDYVVGAVMPLVGLLIGVLPFWMIYSLVLNVSNVLETVLLFILAKEFIQRRKQN